MALFGLVSESQMAELTEQLQAEVAQSEFLQERLAELELALDEIGWERLAYDAEWEFSRDGLDRIIALARLNAIKNPLIKRAVGVKATYVFGQGVEIQAREDEVNQVVQQFIDDAGNQTELFSNPATLEKQRTLTNDGNVVFVLFPNKLTGHVAIRSVDVGEIRDVIVNPDDRRDVWFYLRRWTEKRWHLDGPQFGSRTIQREAWYPDWRHQPPGGQRWESIERIPVRWDSPIYHVRVGGLEGMRFGLPDTYAALDWAKAYKLFLEDWATIVRSLSRFAWSMTVKKNPAAAAARMNTTVSVDAMESNPASPAGSVFVGTEGTSLSPLPKTDAVIDSDDGLLLAKMVAAAVGIPYTILMGDPDQGNLATAKTLDRPTELEMMSWRQVWAQVLRDLCGYAVDWSVRAPGGALNGRLEAGPDGKPMVVLDDTTVPDPDNGPDATKPMTGVERRTIDVTFPPILEDEILPKIQAIVAAFGTDLPAPKLILRLILTALGVEDVDEHIANFDEEYEARQKAEMDRMVNAGDVAIAAARQGLDPADATK